MMKILQYLHVSLSGLSRIGSHFAFLIFSTITRIALGKDFSLTYVCVIDLNPKCIQCQSVCAAYTNIEHS